MLAGGTHVRKGDMASWCPYAEDRSTKDWGRDAKEFKPQCWITDGGQLIQESHGKWPGFNAGLRIYLGKYKHTCTGYCMHQRCVGKIFAIFQVLITITTLLRRYKFSLVPNQEIRYAVSLIMAMTYGLNVLVEKRY
ncbi:cytochrome P450 [Fennellomyces sp. T-0311]|nr:cytochrome P450 [Fennellomyces sp. T-0311]